MGYTSSTSFAMPLSKVDNKKSAKSTIPSGIPSAAISSTRSGKERILTDYYQNFSKKAGSRSSESSKGAAASPPSSPSKSGPPNETQKTPEAETQNPSPSATGAQTSPPPQDGDVLAPSYDAATVSDGARNDVSPPSVGSSVMALLASNVDQEIVPVPGAQGSPPPQDGDVLAPSLEEVTANGETTKDELPPSVESSVMALLNSDDNQEPAPIFDFELEPSPETLEPGHVRNPDLSLESNFLQNPTPDESLANTSGAQALLLAPNLPNPNFKPSPSTDILSSPKPSQNSNPITIPPTTPSSSISSPSVPSNIQHFNKLAASAQTHPPH